VCHDPPVRVLAAPDHFLGILTAAQVAGAVREGWRTTAPDDDVRLCPLSDGGAGVLETLHATLGGEVLSVTASSPLGERVPAAVLVVDVASGTRTAYVEAAHAVGTALVPTERRDPVRATSAGLGVLLRCALDSGARRVVVGVGEAASHDAGAGMLAALGVGGGPDGVLGAGGGALGTVTPADLAGLAEVRAAWAGVDLVAACATDLPLLGLHGASATDAERHGATAGAAQDLERSFGGYAHAAVAALGTAAGRPDLLLSARPATPVARLTGLPGAGAGGGLGFGLALLGARLLPGAAVVAEAVGLRERVEDVDLVLTGERSYDGRSRHDSVTATVAEHALAAGVPTVVLAGHVHAGRRELAAAGIAAAYPVADPGDDDGWLADPRGSLSSRAARVARTWSR
jgi:glycerate kinase